MQDRGLQDKDVAQVIIQRLKSTNVTVPFAEIARSAKEEGRKDLASLVIDVQFVNFKCTFMFSDIGM